jgi:hypothetical protein
MIAQFLFEELLSWNNSSLDLKVGLFRVTFFCPFTKNVDSIAHRCQLRAQQHNNERTNRFFVSLEAAALSFRFNEARWQ